MEKFLKLLRNWVSFWQLGQLANQIYFYFFNFRGWCNFLSEKIEDTVCFFTFSNFLDNVSEMLSEKMRHIFSDFKYDTKCFSYFHDYALKAHQHKVFPKLKPIPDQLRKIVFRIDPEIEIGVLRLVGEYTVNQYHHFISFGLNRGE